MKEVSGFPQVEGTSLIVESNDRAVYVMPSGSKYSVFNTNKEYVNQEYPEGGFVVHFIRSEEQNDYIDHSPDVETLYCFMKALSRKKG